MEILPDRAGFREVEKLKRGNKGRLVRKSDGSEGSPRLYACVCVCVCVRVWVGGQVGKEEGSRHEGIDQGKKEGEEK